MLHEIGALVGEANTDLLNELPAPVLFGWRDYLELIHGDASEPRSKDGRLWLDPAQAVSIFKERYG